MLQNVLIGVLKIIYHIAKVIFHQIYLLAIG